MRGPMLPAILMQTILRLPNVFDGKKSQSVGWEKAEGMGYTSDLPLGLALSYLTLVIDHFENCP